MLRPLRFVFPAVGLLALAASALASELWLYPSRFFVAPGARQHIHVFVGENFAGARWPGHSRRLVRFVHYGPTDSTDLTAAARAADTLNTTVAFDQPGLHLLALQTTNAFAELGADQFNAYLRAQGLDDALALRQARNELGKPAREAYARCAKTLVQAGAGGPAQAYAQVVGHPLELVPDQNPGALPSGASLTVRVLAHGQPVRGALVRVWQRLAGQPTQVFSLRSNQNGRVLFKLSGADSYLVSTVRMEPAAAQAADWQSTWATLTFGVPGISGR